MHQYIFLKLNKGMAAKCRVDDQNGFEMWRKLHKAIDPTHPEEGRQIISRIRSLFPGPSASTEELWKKIAAQDKLNAEHLDKLGRYAPDSDLTSNVWFGLTAELAREAARAEIEQDGCSYRKIKEFIEQSREFDRRFAKRKVDKDVEMGISSAAPGPEPPESAAVSGDSSAVAASPQPGSDASLDALGGKGKGKGVMKCYGCDGEGHLQRLFPSVPGHTIVCNNCYAKGHFAA